MLQKNASNKCFTRMLQNNALNKEAAAETEAAMTL